MLGRDGRIRHVNLAWSRFGVENTPGGKVPPSSSVGVDYVGLCRSCQGPEAGEAAVAAAGIEDVLGGRRPSFVLEYPCDSPTEARWFAMHVTPLVDEDGGVVVAHHDITTRRKAEQSAASQSQRATLALRAARMGVWRMDVTSGQIHWSPEVFDIVGVHAFDGTLASWRGLVHPDDLPEMVASFVHPDDQAGLTAVVQRLVAGELVRGFENRYRCRDGSYRWFSWNAIPVRESGVIYGIIRDVTEEKRLSEQFRQSQKMEAVGQLASGVAHDFNNLLIVINGYTELLLDGTGLGDPQRDSLTQILEAGHRAGELTSQLLAFGLKALVEPKVLDINQVIGASARLLRRLIGETVRLETRLSSVPLVRIDPGQLDQVFLNLVVNARDAMPDGGRLTIATDAVAALPAGLLLEGDLAPGPYVMVTVTDTGTGMPREVQARIFEPFFTTKGPGKGTGLGLASVYGVVRQAGGVITVDSQLGVGTRFSLWFPAVQALPSPPPPSEALRTPGGAETVLLAEDESGVRNVASAILRAQGYVVLVAENGTQAARLAAEHAGTIDLLLTDVVMPDFGGRALVDLVRAVRPGVRVLYMSGYTDDAVFRGGTGSPPDAFLQKPFTPGTLARRVREVLDAERAVRPG